MGVYLPNMEMPTRCEDCPLERCDENYYGDESGHRCSLIYKGYTSNNRCEKRLDDCPLVPVPPHGDLIDAQEQMRLMQSCEYDTYDDYSRAFDMLDNAPTIIPAEEGE